MVAQWLRIRLLQCRKLGPTPSWETEIPHATGQLHLHAASPETHVLRSPRTTTRQSAATKDPHDAMKILELTPKTAK